MDPAKQKKQLVVLAGAATVLALVLLRGRGPDAAEASPEPAFTPGQMVEVSGGTIHIPPIAHSARLVAEWRREPIPHLTRNLFRSDLTAPPKPVEPVELIEPEVVHVEPAGPTGLFWQALEHSLAERAERARRREQAIESFMADVRRLRISSVLTGATPRVLIDSELFGPGDEVGAGPSRLADRLKGTLRVERITPDGIELGRGVLRAWLPASDEPPRRLKGPSQTS